jgi:hypothetical protein
MSDDLLRDGEVASATPANGSGKTSGSGRLLQQLKSEVAAAIIGNAHTMLLLKEPESP